MHINLGHYLYTVKTVTQNQPSIVVIDLSIEHTYITTREILLQHYKV